MSEQEQTETKSGGGVAGVLAGGAAGAATYLKYSKPKAENTLVASALDGSLVKDKEGKALEAATKAEKAVKDGLKQTGPDIQNTHFAAQELKKAGQVDKITGIKFTQAADGKSFNAAISDGERTGHIVGIKSLPKDVKLGEDKVAAIAGEDLKKLTEGGDKSWVAKTAATAEKDVSKAIRGSEAFKAAGGAFKTASKGGKAAIVLVPVVAAVAVGAVAKSVFAGKHASQVEADRAAAPEQGAARA